MADEPQAAQPITSPGESTRRVPILVDGGGAWQVALGAVDLFATRVAGGEPAGARRHLFRVEAGGVLLGAGLARDRDQVGLLAVPLQGTRLEPLQGAAALTAGAVDAWLEALCSSVAVPLPSRLDALLAPFHELELPDQASAHAGRAVVWARALQGSFVLGGFAAVQPSSESWTPVSSDTWLRATGAVRLEIIDTPRLLSLDPALSHLAAFQRACLGRLGEQLSADEARAGQRILQRTAADDDAMRSALGELAGVLRSGGSEASAADPGENLLLHACQLVGEATGVAIQAPPRLGDRTGREALPGIARASRFRTRQVMLRGEWWRADSGALLGWRKGEDRPVALLLTPALRYELVEPSTGARTPITAAVAATLEPWADSFYMPFPARALRAADLFLVGLRSCDRRDLWRILFFGLIGGLLGMAPAIATGIVFDRVVPSGEQHLLGQVGVALLVTIVAAALLQLARSLAVLRVETRTASAVQAGIWDRLLGLPVSFFRQYLSGDLAVRSLGIEAIRQVLTGATLSSLLGGVFSIFSFGLLFYYDRWLALLATGLVVVAGAVVVLLGNLALRQQRGLQRVAGEVSGLVLQLLGGIAKLRVAGAERRGFSVFARRFAEQKQLAVKTGTVANWLAVFESVFPSLAIAVLFAAAAPAPGGPLSTASFLAFYAAFGQFLSAGLQMSTAILEVLQVVPTYERARPILETPPEVTLDRAPPGELEGRLELSHVSFRYRPDGPKVLDDVSLQAGAGELVAIVGPSGAGKSTVMRLLLGFETPASGSISVDGKVLSTLDVQAVRRQMGVVLQHGQLLAGSLYQNIVGATSLGLDDAWAAARLAGLAADIEAMPMGMHTYIPEGGSTLSGGQRQRLLIARAVASRPRMLLFDEATSALDNQTQAQVTASLAALRATRIVIAHRLSTIAGADRIYVMQGGRVVQSGGYAELSATPGPFADLARRQLAYSDPVERRT